nr:hypothetical protein [Tanacetum cinerariifolium]
MLINKGAGGSGDDPVIDDNVRQMLSELVDVRFNRMQDSIDALTRMMAANEFMEERNIERNARNGQQLPYARLAKLEFPKFSSDDVKGSVFRRELFFILDQVTEAKNTYKQAVLARFGTVTDDPISELKNLKYETTAKAYEDAFDDLLSRIEIGEDHAISLFMVLLEVILNVVKKKSKMLYGGSNSSNTRFNALVNKGAEGSSDDPVIDDNVRQMLSELVDVKFNIMQDSIDALTRMMAANEFMEERNIERNAGNGQQLPYARLAKLEFPKFSNDDVKGSVFRREPFFILDHVTEAKNYETTAKAYEDAFDDLLSRIETDEDHAISLFMVLLEVILNVVKKKSKMLYGGSNSSNTIFNAQGNTTNNGQMYALEVLVDSDMEEECLGEEDLEDSRELP